MIKVIPDYVVMIYNISPHTCMCHKMRMYVDHENKKIAVMM